MKILFVCDLKYPQLWKDGLWAALERIKERPDVELSIWNLHEKSDSRVLGECDFVLGWGAFGSKADAMLRSIKSSRPELKIGLCIGGTAQPPTDERVYDVLFYETEWYKKTYLKEYIQLGGIAVHAFGVNTDIYYSFEHTSLIDWLSVGSFSLWKRLHAIIPKDGVKLVIGEIQKENMGESMGIIEKLLAGGVGVMDMVPPEKLSWFYNLSKNVIIPCALHGGGERAVLEARACGVPVEVLDDNPKLMELTTSPIWDHIYYSFKLMEGITTCLARSEQ